jgi:hypothetical protein
LSVCTKNGGYFDAKTAISISNRGSQHFVFAGERSDPVQVGRYSEAYCAGKAPAMAEYALAIPPYK